MVLKIDASEAVSFWNYNGYNVILSKTTNVSVAQLLFTNKATGALVENLNGLSCENVEQSEWNNEHVTLIESDAPIIKYAS